MLKDIFLGQIDSFSHEFFLDIVPNDIALGVFNSGIEFVKKKHFLCSYAFSETSVFENVFFRPGASHSCHHSLLVKFVVQLINK